ncbi:MAG: Smr/MutS family protein [Deltaproteobacteria bacterium]|jgi:DNA-nicking Smr family endonuclease|nr:Smr/MutS family protein [Deltaproteobacteria bacterium]MBW2500944.1 Smr/MutS family protein [Deltaproteobacteria bacterium]
MIPEDEEETRFADLFGPAKPVDKGKARVAPRRPQANADASAKASRTQRERSGASGPDFRWPSPQERRLAAAAGVSDARLRSLERGEIPSEERIDLHGLRRDAAESALAKRLESARERGLRCVLVIHGRGARSPGGEGVLRDALPDWLTGSHCARHVLAFAPARPTVGGEGATLVLLRRDRHRSA